MPVLYLFGTAAPPVLDLPDVVARAQADGWTVCVGLTTTAADWLADKVPELEELTGHPVRSALRRPDETEVWPEADAALVAPATLNTINTCALGLTPHFVAAYVVEGMGKRWPITLMPCVNSAYATHPRFDASLSALRSSGVNVLYGEGGFVPNPPGTSDPSDYPWQLALDAAREDAAASW
ncbi:flavoprotein [Streptomyces sp. ODS28]|uniref:flavoprotein n=1 Tax=Streptomyces sp. ODS28 TaxID=3136688 RepID=UPI0031E822EF